MAVSKFSLATGLNLSFGVMKLANFVHGELLMVGAYVAFHSFPPRLVTAYLAVFVSMGVVALIGIALEKH